MCTGVRGNSRKKRPQEPVVFFLLRFVYACVAYALFTRTKRKTVFAYIQSWVAFALEEARMASAVLKGLANAKVF